MGFFWGKQVKTNKEEFSASLQCRRILASSRASAFDQASAILDSNSEEAWGETKMRPREWELG